MLAGSVHGNAAGPASSWMARTLGAAASARSRLLTIILIAAMVVGLAGVGIYNRAEIADIISRGAKVLGAGASAMGNSPLAKSMAALLDQRSPGQRTQAELANDKQRYAERPRQRALGKIRPALPVPFVKALTNPVPDVVPGVVPLAQSPLAPSIVPAAIISPPPVFVGGGGGGGGPGGGGGGPPGGGDPPPPGVELPPVTPPVPEPSTWLMMMLGFCFLARALRGQRPVTARRAALAA